MPQLATCINHVMYVYVASYVYMYESHCVNAITAAMHRNALC